MRTQLRNAPRSAPEADLKLAHDNAMQVLFMTDTNRLNDELIYGNGPRFDNSRRVGQFVLSFRDVSRPQGFELEMGVFGTRT